MNDVEHPSFALKAFHTELALGTGAIVMRLRAFSPGFRV